MGVDVLHPERRTKGDRAAREVVAGTRTQRVLGAARGRRCSAINSATVDAIVVPTVVEDAVHVELRQEVVIPVDREAIAIDVIVTAIGVERCASTKIAERETQDQRIEQLVVGPHGQAGGVEVKPKLAGCGILTSEGALAIRKQAETTEEA